LRGCFGVTQKVKHVNIQYLYYTHQAQKYMIQRLFFFVFFASLLSVPVFAQHKTLPAVQVKTVEGQLYPLAELGKSGRITVVSCWATWCSPCKKELDTILEVYEEWQTAYNVDLVAVSVDDARTAAKIPAMVAEKGWPYRILVDNNRAFQQGANIASVPHTLLIDQQGHIVYEHVGYQPGDEVELEEKIKALARKK
jgi:cytochrome c biogenesis protein CcmG, thiol:disulfide interchange protein DsbE